MGSNVYTALSEGRHPVVNLYSVFGKAMINGYMISDRNGKIVTMTI